LLGDAIGGVLGFEEDLDGAGAITTCFVEDFLLPLEVLVGVLDVAEKLIECFVRDLVLLDALLEKRLLLTLFWSQTEQPQEDGLHGHVCLTSFRD
jgi:hypothetical protein